MKEKEKNEPKRTSFLDAVREFFHGMFAHEAVVATLQEKAAIENLLFLAIFGDMIASRLCRSTIRCGCCLSWCPNSTIGDAQFSEKETGPTELSIRGDSHRTRKNRGETSCKKFLPEPHLKNF